MIDNLGILIVKCEYVCFDYKNICTTKFKDNIVQKVSGKSEIVVGVWGEEEEVVFFIRENIFNSQKIINRGPVGRVEKHLQKDKIVEFKW